MKWGEKNEAVPKRENKHGTSAMFYGLQKAAHRAKCTWKHRGGIERQKLVYLYSELQKEAVPGISERGYHRTT
jgi:hypothetical protein